MSIRNLDRIFKPHRVAVVGEDVVGEDYDASCRWSTVIDNLLKSGFQGDIVPVLPGRKTVRGLESCPSILDLPAAADLALICTPAPRVPEIVRQCGESGVAGLVILSSGFPELADEARALEQQILEETRRFDGLRIIGPNSYGFIVPRLHLNASLSSCMPKSGQIAFASQSRSIGASVLDWALEEDTGFSYFVSVGNMLDVDFGDLIDYFASDSETRSLVLYAESVTQARKFVSAARAFTRAKPIVICRAGRYSSWMPPHFRGGVPLGEDAVYEAAFERSGIVRVDDTIEMFDCAELLARQRPPRGGRLGIITNALGSAVMAVDALLGYGGTLASFSEETIGELDQQIPRAGSQVNPVHVFGNAPPHRFKAITETVLNDNEVDAVLLILSPPKLSDPVAIARAVGQAARQSSKPVLGAWMGGHRFREGVAQLDQAGIPTYRTSEQAVQAFMRLVSYTQNRKILYETPKDSPMPLGLDRDALRRLFDEKLGDHQEVLPETTSKDLLEAYGIAVTRPRLAQTATQCVEAARQIGYPVVLKVHSAQIIHKTDVGGVILNLTNDTEVRVAFDEILSRAQEKRPGAPIEGVTVQPMAASPHGFEMVLGALKDPLFGAAILIAMGGIQAEIFRDRSVGLPPLNERLARRMLESLRSWPLLQGYRGRPRAHLEKLTETLVRFSYLVADFPQIRSIDVNPLWITPEEVIALDARVSLEPEMPERSSKPYEHLVIRPYPEHYVRTVRLSDGTGLVLRPIRPEDEPRWHDMLARCSSDTLYQRFQYAFKRTHEMAARFCFIDYDREMAIVAEVEEQTTPRLVGVGRLVADPDHEAAEYAVLVADDYQGRGLGRLLTETCLEIGGSWGLKRVTAVTTPDNSRMLRIFRELGFQIQHDIEQQTVYLTKKLC